jgi:beta-phosphoglucomutase
MFAEHGVPAQREDFELWVGTGENSYLGNVAKQYGFDIDIERDKARTYEIYGEIVRGRLKALPGASDFVAGAGEGSKTALATSSDKGKMIDTLREIGLPTESFDAAVNGLDVERRKPHPDIFLGSGPSNQPEGRELSCGGRFHQRSWRRGWRQGPVCWASARLMSPMR